MQALAFYILLRIDEGETEYNNLDFLLLATVTVLAKQITWDSLDSLRPQSLTHTESQAPTEIDAAWRDWVHEESRRRYAHHPFILIDSSLYNSYLLSSTNQYKTSYNLPHN
jgi:hypothetical protein